MPLKALNLTVIDGQTSSVFSFTGTGSVKTGDIIAIAGVPTGWTLVDLSTNQIEVGSTWTVHAGDLLQLIAPSDSVASDAGFSLTATDTTAKTSAPFTVTVAQPPPSLTLQDASGTENSSAIPLSIGAAPIDSDDTVTVTISGVPSGWSLNHGTRTGRDTWTLQLSQLVGHAGRRIRRNGCAHCDGNRFRTSWRHIKHERDAQRSCHGWSQRSERDRQRGGNRYTALHQLGAKFPRHARQAHVCDNHWRASGLEPQSRDKQRKWQLDHTVKPTV